MRFIAFIFVLATISRLDASVRFARAEWFPDIGISMPVLEEAVAVPVDMPKAEAYLVTVDGKTHLEDRFDTFDLWTALTVRGRWRDAAGNELLVARLESELPDDQVGVTRTRGDFRKRLKPLGVKDAGRRDEAVSALFLEENLSQPVKTRRNGRRNFIELLRYPTTNENVLVYAFRPRSPERRETPGWYVVSLSGAQGEDASELEETFDESFLENVELPKASERTDCVPPPPENADETELLREDYRRNVANYSDWHFTSSGDLMITDNLDAQARTPFLAALTNDLPRLRREYASAVPSRKADTFHPAAIRVFRTREEYLAYVGVEARWTAALWSPTRRELVLYLPEQGVDNLLHTVWHEAFHQYLSYAGLMLSPAPWVNEGHAELFEHSHFDPEGNVVFDRNYEYARFVELNVKQLAGVLPAMLEMDYDEFYAGDQFERETKYRLAWSVAYFLQVGAPEIRFRPFEKLRGDYMDALISTRSGLRATRKVFTDEMRKDFIAEWQAYWKKE